MVRMTVSLDEKVIDEARRLLMTKTKRETIETALREIIKQKKREKAIKHKGKIELDVNEAKLRAFREL